MCSVVSSLLFVSMCATLEPAELVMLSLTRERYCQDDMLGYILL